MPDLDGDYLLTLPYLALIASMAVMAMSAILVMVAKRFDPSGGKLTVSIIIIVSVVTATYAALVYNINQNPLSEILIGGLATALGAVVAFWVGK